MKRICALEHALKHVGLSEQPPGSNRGPLIDKWNAAVGVPLGTAWCLSFVHGMYAECGTNLGGHALVESFEQWASQKGYLVTRPFRGDIVCFDWNADNWYDHVGIVRKVLALRWRGKTFAGLIATVEGNTGNAVRLRTRWVLRAKFARIPG